MWPIIVILQLSYAHQSPGALVKTQLWVHSLGEA